MAGRLTDDAIQNARPKEKKYKIYDLSGLFLLVAPAGGKWWRFKYRLDGKEKQISLGTYPAVGLAKARSKRDKAREQVANDIDPSQARKALKAAKQSDENTFEVIAREWFGKFEVNWAPGHAIKIKRRLENDVYPYIGQQPNRGT